MASYIYDSTDNYLFSSADYGFLYEVQDSAEDFGLITAVKDTTEDYHFVTVTSNNSTPFGFSTASGSAKTWKPKRYSYSSSSDNLYTLEDYGDIVQIERYGELSQSPVSILDWGSLGSITSSEDFGVVTTFSASIPDSTEDYGTITVDDNIITREDRYLIITNESFLAMETAYTFSPANALEEFVASLDGSGVLSIYGGSSMTGVTAAISKVSIAWAGNGTPFEIGGSANEIVKAFSTVATSGPLRLDITSSEVFAKKYSFDAVLPFNILDYGSVPVSPSLDVDFGFVSQATFGGEKDYGLITDTQEITPYGLYESAGVVTESFAKGLYTGTGSVTVSGYAIIPVNASVVGTGSATFSGGYSNLKFVSQGGETTQLFNLSGTAVEKNREVFIGTGSTSIDITKVEKNTESYVGNAVVTKLVTPDSFEINTGSFVNVAVFNSGTGTGTTGGFNIGRHIKFGTTGTTGARRFDLNPIDASAYSIISFTAIRGDSANGGEAPDASGEDLQLLYSTNGGSSFTLIGNIITYNDTSFNSIKTVDITLPAGAKTSSTIFRINQPATSGVTFDHYGITKIELESALSQNFVLSGGYTNLKFTSGGGETTQLFALSGSAVEKNTEDYVGTGEAFINVTSVEKNTEAYVSELAQVTDLFVDYGDLSTATESEQYGQLTFNNLTNVDYRYLTSDFYEIAGAAVEKFIAQTPENTQIFVFSGSAVEKFTSGAGESTQIFAFSGSGVEKNTEDYVGEGTFSSFSGAAESVTYRYSFDSFVPFFEFDYGNVSQAPSNEINLGSVSAPNTGGEQDYGVITNNQTVFPYGLLQTSGTALDAFSKQIVNIGGTINIDGFGIVPVNAVITGSGSVNITGTAVEKFSSQGGETTQLFSISGSGVEKNREVFVASGSTSFTGTATEKFRGNPPEDFAQFTFSGSYSNLRFTSGGGETTQLFSLSGSAIEKNRESYVGTGSTSIDITKVEKNTESYFAPLPAFIYANIDNGQIGDPAVNENYGLITVAANEFENNQSIVHDYLKTGGSATEAFIAQSPENTQLFIYTGAGVEKNTESYVGDKPTYTLTGNRVEKNTESYVGTGTATFDIFSEVRKTLPSYVGFGFAFTANGSAEVFGANPPENTQLFQISGAAISKTNPKWIGSGTINIDVTSVEKNTESYVGTGSLFSIVDGSEARTYVYDESTIVEFLEFDYGNLTQPVDVINDYGNITTFFNEVDYGTVVYTESVFPFGSAFFSGAAIDAFSPNPPEETQLFVFSGSAVEKFTSGGGETTQLFTLSGSAVEKNTEDYVGTGITTFSGTKVEKNTEVFIGSGSTTLTGTRVEKNTESYVGDNPIYTLSGTAVEKFTTQGGESIQLFNLSGSAVDKNTESYVGTGNLFSIVDGSEARTYIYVAQSPDTPATILTETYDDITQTANAYENYGFITDAVTTSEDYGITDAVEFFVLKGAADESFNRGVYSGQTDIQITGEARIREEPRWIGGGGGKLDITSIQKRARNYVGTGDLFNIGDGTEARVYIYDETSIVPFLDLDYGNITQSPSVETDLGFVSLDITGGEQDYGTVIYTQSVFPFGSAFFGGAAVESFSAQTPEDTQLFTFSGTIIEKNTEAFSGSGTLTASGTVVEKNRESYVATGSLFTFSGVSQSFGANPPETEVLFTFGGTAKQKININFPEDTAIFYVSGSAAEKFTTQAGESTQLFTYSGSGAEKNTERYIGVGSTTLSGTITERNTESYTVEIPEILNEYRNRIKDPATSTEDYGLISAAANEFDVWGILAISYINLTPAAVVIATPKEIGRGTLFATSGAAEVFGANPVENTQIFTFGGSSIIIDVHAWNGTGSAAFTGDADEDLVKVFDGNDGQARSIIIDGNAGRIGIRKYQDTVVLYTSGSASESFTSGAGESTQIFSFGSSSQNSLTEVYAGTGNLFSVGDSADARVYVYGKDVIIGFNEVDYGFITETPTVDIDYSTITIGEIGGIIDYGQIRFEETIISATGLVDITGAVYVTTSPAYYGSGTLTVSDTALEKNTEVFSGTGTTSLTGVALENNTERYIGTGNVSTFSGAAEVFGANPVESTQLFVFSGTRVEKNTESYIGTGTTTFSGTKVEKNTEAFRGTGSLFTSFGAAEVSVVNPPESVQLFALSGAAVEKNTEVFTGTGSTAFTGTRVEKNTESYVGAGSSTLSGTKIEKNTEAFNGTGIATLSGTKVEKNTESYVGVGSVFTVSGAAEAFGANPPENTQLFIYTGAAVEKNTEKWVGTGSTTLSGTKVEKNTEAFRGTGTTTLSGVGVEKNTEVFRATGSATLSGVAATREIAVYGYYGNDNNPGTSGKITISNSAAAEVSVRYWRGTGTATLTGIAVEKNTEVFRGSGEFFAFLGAAESRTVNPEEDTVLYTFVGAAVEKNTEKFVGSGTRTFSGIAKEKNTESYVGTGTRTFSGIGVEKNTEVFRGSGNLFTTGGHAEVFGVNPPENTQLFTYAGAAVERNTESYFGTGTETLTGTAIEKNTESYVGTGVLNALSGAAEAYSAQTPENTVLFKFTGAGSQRFIAQTPERTVLFTFSNFWAYEKNTEAHFGTGSASITGTAVEKNTEAYNGTGTLTASGTALQSYATVQKGSGELFNYNGAAESFGTNPPEDISLFTVLGSAVERNTEAHFASGGAFVTGTAIQKNTEAYEGTGTATLTGISFNSKTTILSGSGTVFTFIGSAEAFGANPPENTELFFTTGSAVERNTEAYQGTGTINPTGAAFTPIVYNYFGTGSVSTFSGAAEAVGVNPPENTQLFSVAGFATEKNTEVYYGEEVLYTSGQGQTPRARIFTASGSLFALSGAAEAVGVNPPESTILFSYSGAAVETNTELHVGSGTSTIAGAAVERNTEAHEGSGTTDLTGIGGTPRVRTFIGSGSATLDVTHVVDFAPGPWIGSGTFTVDAFSSERIANSYEGGGSLFTIGGAAESITFSVDNVLLATISGSGETPRARTFIGSGTATIDVSHEFTFRPGPWVGRGTATITGSLEENITNSYVGDGSLFNVGGSYITTTRSVDNTVLFNVNGSAGTDRIRSYNASGTLFAINGAAESTTINPVDSTIIFNISGSSATVNNPYRPPRTYVSII